MLTVGQRTWLIIGAALWLIVLPTLVERLLKRLCLIRPNYRGEEIPVGYGLVILFWSGPLLLTLARLIPDRRDEFIAYLFVVTGLGALGFIDDLWGDRSARGLRGHLMALLRRERFTTGVLKALGGLALSLAVLHSVLHRNGLDLFLDGAIVALTANALNLLDLRPGRAGAVFLLGAFGIVGQQSATHFLMRWPALVCVLIPELLVQRRDARACVMLGDTGSNLLGGALGLAYVLAYPSSVARWGGVVALTLLHVIAERLSLSALIERNALLRRLDSLTGRRG